MRFFIPINLVKSLDVVITLIEISVIINFFRIKIRGPQGVEAGQHNIIVTPSSIA